MGEGVKQKKDSAVTGEFEFLPLGKNLTLVKQDSQNVR